MKRFLQSLVLVSAVSMGVLSFQPEAQANPHYDALKTQCDSRARFTFVGPNVCFYRGGGDLIIESVTADGYGISQLFAQLDNGHGTMRVMITDRDGSPVVASTTHSDGSFRVIGEQRHLALFINDIQRATDAVEYWISESER